MANNQDGENKRPTILRLVAGTSAFEKSQLVNETRQGELFPPADATVSADIKVFRVLFRAEEKLDGLWGNAFRGDYTLGSIVEIMDAFDRNGVRLECLFLEDRLEPFLDEINAAFEAIKHGGAGRWHSVLAVDPMMFAAAKGLSRAVCALAVADTFKANPDQVLDGCINALGAVLRAGYCTDTVLCLLVAEPSRETIIGALEEIRCRRSASPDMVGTHQRFTCAAVVKILEDELASGGRFLKFVDKHPD